MVPRVAVGVVTRRIVVDRPARRPAVAARAVGVVERLAPPLVPGEDDAWIAECPCGTGARREKLRSKHDEPCDADDGEHERQADDETDRDSGPATAVGRSSAHV